MEEVQKNVDNIRKECDEIEKRIKPKKARTYGDPIVQLKD